MKLVHVIPIAKGIQKDQLSYFSAKPFEHGTIVSVPVRKKVIPAIVIDSEDVIDVKAKLKSNDFAMKKVGSNKSRTFLLPAFMRASEEAAFYFAGTVGSVLHQVVPSALLSNIEKIEEPPRKLIEKDVEFTSEQLAFQAKESSRIDDYKRIVREAFARGKSVYILTPTIKRAEFFGQKLEKGIGAYVHVLHSSVSKKELLKRVNKAISDKHPVLMIGTGGFLSVPRSDIETIIVENENARSFKQQSRPYIDFRIFASILAKHLGARIIYADQPLSIETMWRLKQREYDELSSTRGRITTPADQYIVDMRPEKGSHDFFLFSSPLLETIEKSLEKNVRTYIFTSRRGLAPSTVCEECGSVVTCKLCHAPVVLHKGNPDNVFVCHSCGDVRSAKERCQVCKSWKLKALGIGSARIVEELKERFGAKRVFTIDSDTTKTYTQASKVAQQFYKTPGAILVGTELSLSFLEEPVSTCAIASIDSLLLLPDPKMYEHVFSLILKIRSKTEDMFILQTRQPELALLKEAVEGDVSKFYEGEILNRKRFSYPPFTVLIKITSHGTIAHITKEMERIEESLTGHSFHIFPAFSKVDKNTYSLSGLLKIQYDTWPDKVLVETLKTLPPNVRVNVRPESTL